MITIDLLRFTNYYDQHFFLHGNLIGSLDDKETTINDISRSDVMKLLIIVLVIYEINGII